MGLKEDLLARAKDRRNRHREEVTALVAERWGDLLKDRRLFVQRMSGHGWSTLLDYRDQYGPDGQGGIKRTNLKLVDMAAQVIVRCLADESGALLFTESAEDVAALSQEDKDMLAALEDVCWRVNGVAGGELKNAPSGEPPSGSPSASASPT